MAPANNKENNRPPHKPDDVMTCRTCGKPLQPEDDQVERLCSHCQDEAESCGCSEE